MMGVDKSPRDTQIITLAQKILLTAFQTAVTATEKSTLMIKMLLLFAVRE